MVLEQQTGSHLNIRLPKRDPTTADSSDGEQTESANFDNFWVRDESLEDSASTKSEG